MNKEKIRQFLVQNQDKITGISVNGYFYNVDYVLDYNLDYDNEVVINCYELEQIHSNGTKYAIETEFTINDLSGFEKLEFYTHTKMEF